MDVEFPQENEIVCENEIDRHTFSALSFVGFCLADLNTQLNMTTVWFITPGWEKPFGTVLGF